MKINFKSLIGVVALVSVSLVATSQVVTQQRTISWKAPVSFKIADDVTETVLTFNDAVNQPAYGKIPVFSEKVDLQGGNNALSVTVTGVVTEALSPAEIAALGLVPKNLPNKVTPTTAVLYANGKAMGNFSFPAIIKNTTLNRLEKITSFTYTATGKNTPMPKSNQSFATTSVLASGRWYKIAVMNDGIYKVDKAFLTTLGMDLTGANPANIRLYGNGGGTLPALNSAPRIDDLGEVAIEVVGGGDNSFDDGDYFLFYGKGQKRWKVNQDGDGFDHVINNYCDTAYYFITTSLGPGKRITNQSSVGSSPTYTATTFYDYALHNEDLTNVLRTGNQWFGEKFDIVEEYTFNFNFPNLVSGNAKIRANVGATCSNTNSFTFKAGGTAIGTIVTPSISPLDSYTGATDQPSEFTFNYSSASMPITVKRQSSSCEGWLDYIEINVKRNLTFAGNQMFFRTLDGVGAGQVTKFVLGNSGSATVWDITDHQNVAKQTVSSDEFTLPTDNMREFVAFNSSAYTTPIAIGNVANQNLHATAPVDFIIVAHPNFLSEANRLADIHRTYDNMDVIVTTPQAIYNEFSSGAADILAIRSFARMLYKRAQTVDEQPKYMLLFGDGSYDNKYRIADNGNFLPTYETDESLNLILSQTADDYYGLLDDNEGTYVNVEPIDIGLGRIPCKNIEEAKNVVDKVVDYINIAGQRDWRNMVTFIGDDQDGGVHTKQSNNLSILVDTLRKAFNLEKVYFDTHVQESTAGGQRYPTVNQAINDRVNRGGLIINYTGHGGEAGWAHEKVMEISDIDSWTNKYALPAFVTATCEFSKFDDPSRTSAGEIVLIRPVSGGICLFTTTRVVYSDPNYQLNIDFYKSLLNDLKLAKMPRMGDLYKKTKVARALFNDGNSRNFTLLGDPALRMDYPVYDVHTTEINGQPVTQTSIDTIKALQLVTVKGYIKDRANGTKLTWYNGTIYPTIYDKPTVITTLGQDTDSPILNFTTQRSIIYKGKASVINGEFTFTFPVPKDIQYQYGYGKISYYAENQVRDQDAHGYKELVIGGSDTSSFCDNKGPEIDLYMNNTNFANGGTTDENPTLLAFLTDTNGINTVGNGIGHDLVAILDNNTNDPFVLNDYYEADLNSYTRGSVRFPFTDLAEGSHVLRFKGWDVCNNSNDATLDFVVARTAGLALNHVLNYPNPFTTNTCFMFEHNRPNQTLDVQVQVFTVAGKIVKTINTSVSDGGFRTDCIQWDGLDDYGDHIGRGVYIYRVKITDELGRNADKFEKLVILN